MKQQGGRLGRTTEEKGSGGAGNKTSSFISHLHLLSKVRLSHIVNKWHPLLVFEFRSRSCQRHTQDGEWNPPATPHPKPARQDAQFFSRSLRCQNGSNVNPTSGFSMAIGPSQARLALRSAVGRISTTSRSTSIPTSSQPSSSCSASGISCSTLPADTLGSLAPISLLSPSSC